MVRGRVVEDLVGGMPKLPGLAGARLGMVAAALERMNEEGLKKALVKLPSPVDPFARLENSMGSTFSRSSISSTSQAFRLAGAFGIAWTC